MSEHIDWPPEYLARRIFWEVSAAIEMYGRAHPGDPYTPLLELLYTEGGPAPVGDHTERQGATYKTLAYIGHRVGLDSKQRAEWYGLCAGLGLTQRHAGHIIKRLNEGGLDQQEAGAPPANVVALFPGAAGA